MSDDRSAAEITNSKDGRVSTVILPCSPDQFSEFIAGLLGKPQTIEAAVKGPFEVTKADVENLYHLITQRVSSQNEATLTQFTARIVYSDDTSVLLNSFNEFLIYNEIKPLFSQALHLSWTYLVKFQNRAFPEKQTIQVSFRAGDNERGYRMVLAWGDDFFDSPISIRIEHTDRSWGTDIDALLKGHLHLLQKPVSKMRRFVNRHSSWIGFGTGALSVAIAMSIAYRLSNQFSDYLVSQAQALKADGRAPSEIVGQQIDFLLSLIASGAWTRFALLTAVLVIASVIGALVLGAVISDKALIRPRSFVLLTRIAQQMKTSYEQDLKSSWYRLAGWIVATLGMGIVGNLIFYLGLTYWTGAAQN